MPTTFTNNWKNILDKLQSTIRSEFGNTLPAYRGFDNDPSGSQYLRIVPTGSTLLEYNSTSETREFSINMILHFKSANIREKALDHILRLVSRLESLIVDNIAMTLTDNSRVFNCRIESTSFDSTDSEEHIVAFDFRGVHMGNFN
mgnify:CR=1 FL=1|tara:strand:+ start:751 stop:1185 length:435 start_codon:yes stop_codon:yes gene_type:complete